MCGGQTGLKQVLSGAVLLGALLLPWATAQQLQPDPVLAPLFDTPASSEKPLVLQGSVKTLDAAISEEVSVDWYGWYMRARSYLAATGGLPCQLGTTIKFHRTGRLEAMTDDPVCRSSLRGRVFPLPRNTELQALLLPVRQGSAPPASREEFLKRVQSQQYD